MEVLYHLITLKALGMSNCKEFTSSWDSHALVSIEYLEVHDCSKVLHLIKEDT